MGFGFENGFGSELLIYPTHSWITWNVRSNLIGMLYLQIEPFTPSLPQNHIF